MKNNKSIIKLILLLLMILFIIILGIRAANGNEFTSQILLTGEKAPFDGRIMKEPDFKELLEYYFQYEACEAALDECSEVNSGNAHIYLTVGLVLAVGVASGVIAYEIGRRKDSP